MKAVVVVPVFANGTELVPSGAELTGKTSDTRAAQGASDTAQEQPAQLKLVFDHLQDRSGQSKAIHCKVADIDNARESVDSAGLITGIAASQTFAARIDQGITKLATRNQQLGALLSTIRSSLINQVDPSITYQPGVDLTLVLTEPLEWGAGASTENQPGEITPADHLVALVNKEPFRTVAQNPPSPSDVTNLMFIGTADEITRAFADAGWSTAAQLGGQSKMETARAIIEDRGYKEAPVSILMLDGRPPDLTFQKQNDTFAKRHHIRVWQRPDGFDGKPVWVAAATHDIGINFSPESKTFTHVIDSNIDLERSKVVSDLLFTHAVNGLALVDRTNLPPNLSNATGDRLQTDGKMAVLHF